MKLIPDKVGAEPKKIAVLIGLIALAGVVYYVNSDSGPNVPTTTGPSRGNAGTAVPSVTGPRTSANSRLPASAVSSTPRTAQRAARRGEAPVAEFKPSFKLPEDVEVSGIDPSLHLDLIAKLRSVAMEGGQRSVFDFGAAPKPAAPPPPVQPIKPAPLPPDSTPVAPPPAPVKPGPPPILLRFYGYVNGSTGGSRQAFFLEGDEIHVAGENDVINNRYRIIRIGLNSAVVEDIATKNQQTLPLVEEMPG
jgi:hypothetical protein